MAVVRDGFDIDPFRKSSTGWSWFALRVVFVPPPFCSPRLDESGKMAAEARTGNVMPRYSQMRAFLWLFPLSSFVLLRNKLCSQERTKRVREPLPCLFPSPLAFCEIYYSDIFTSIRYLASFVCISPSFSRILPRIPRSPLFFFFFFTSASITECTLPRSKHPFHSGRLHAKPFKLWPNAPLELCLNPI